MELNRSEGSSCDDQYCADEGDTEKVMVQHHHHHHEHHHDRSVHVHGNVGNVATGNGHSGDMVATVINSHQQEKQQEEIARELEDWTEGMVETTAFKKVMEMLNNGTTWITIKGSPGEGKTTVAKMALRELQKSGRQVFQARSPDEIAATMKNTSRPVILLDDVLGDLEFDQAAWLRWKAIFHQILDAKEHRCHERDANLSHMKEVIILLVARDYVLNSASVPMGRLYNFITKRSHVLDMSHSIKRTLGEKHMIWDAVVGASGIVVPQESIDYILQLEGQHGFPHVCRLYVTIHKENPSISAKAFFKTPLAFLNETVNMLVQNRFRLRLFKEMIKMKGKVSERDLQRSGHEVIKTAKDLMGTYLRMEDGYFVFDHPSIYDSVAFNLCTYHTLFVIKNCKLSFIHERLRFHDEGYTLRGETDLVMCISKPFVVDLAKRFADELSKNNFRLVLSHQACTQENMIKEVISRVTRPMVELKNMTDSDSGESFLSLLASNKSPQLLKHIEMHTDIQLTQSDINIVLYGVCKYAASDVLSYLKQTRHTLDINVKYANEQTPIMIAAETRDSQFVHQILSLGPDLTARTRDNKTALHYMCSNGLVSAVRLMFSKGIDINVKDRRRWSPLVLACLYNHVDIVKELLERGAWIDKEAILAACQIGNIDVVMVLLREAKFNVASLIDTVFEIACTHSHVDIIRYLIQKGTSVNMTFANEFDSTPLHLVCAQNDLQGAECLIQHGAVIDSRRKNGETPLHSASERGSKECLLLLLKAGADVNVQSLYGSTALHLAVSGNGSEDCVEMLLTAGADVNVQSINGETPLHDAVYYQPHCYPVYLPDIIICRTLIQHGAGVNNQNRDGNTPLHLLCRIKSDTEVIQGNWSRHTASSFQEEYRALVKLLIDRGTDVNIHNNRGEPALRGWCQTLCS